eukprot:scaffold89525_cov63-Phaeocystis_antarctica.AAC.3
MWLWVRRAPLALCAARSCWRRGARIIIITSNVPLATATGFAHFHARPVRGGGPPSTIRQPSPSSTCRAGGSSGPSTTYLRTRARVDAMRFDPRYQVRAAAAYLRLCGLLLALRAENAPRQQPGRILAR